MTIEPKNLVLYQSERLTDTPDGGGQYNGQIVIDGQSNNLFTDVSELDRTMGRVSLRKIFAGVNTADTDMLMGATVFVSKNPIDPNVSALLFSTQSHTDERSQAQNRIENYLAKGGQVAGVPLDTHWQGMKIVQVCMFLSDEPSKIGDCIVLISNENKPNQVEQYVRILKVDTRIAKMMVDGKEVEYKIATYTINDPLTADFVGLSAQQWYRGDKSETIIRDTLVADTGKYFGSVPVTEPVKKGDFTVKGQSIFAQLVPSAQAETPIVDVNAVGERVALVAGNSQKVQFKTPVDARTSQNLYIGSSVLPNSVSFSLNEQAVKDDGGLLKYANGTQIGTIDYQRGLIQWSIDIGSFSAVVIEFTPAVAQTQPTQSDSIIVTQKNQSLNYTGMLVPIPTMGSVSISYMAQGKFYELRDMGNGQLKAFGDGLGSGTIDYETGSWVLTCGALPDVDTPILIHWATPITTFSRADLAVKPAQIAFELNHQGIASSSVTALWQVNGEQKTAQSNAQGQFTGDATGFINYASGTGYLIPNVLPQKGTEITLNYQYGTPKLTAQRVSPDTNNTLRFKIGSGSIAKNSVEILVPFPSGVHVTLTDVPTDGNMGNMVDGTGKVQGTIDYATGQVVIKPSYQVKSSQFNYSALDYGYIMEAKK